MKIAIHLKVLDNFSKKKIFGLFEYTLIANNLYLHLHIF